MAEDEAAAGAGEGDRWAWVRPVLTVVMVVAGAAWIWSVVRWIAKGQAAYGIPALLMVVACGIWLATFGRGRTIEPSSWDPHLTVVRVSRAREARASVIAALVPVVFLVNGLTATHREPTVPAAIYLSCMGVFVLIAVVSIWRNVEAELTISDDEIAFTLPKGPLPGRHLRARRRDSVDGYRRRFGSLELLPWPLPGGASGPGARRRRVVISTMVLAAGDVERALQLHGIRPA